MKILDSSKKNFYNELNKILDKRKAVDRSTLKIIEKIINDVRKNRDKALIKYEKRFNANSRIIPNNKDITKAIKLIDPKIKKAIDETCKRVKDWHVKQKPKDIFYKDKLNNKFYYKNKAIIEGNTKFIGAELMSSDLRASVALVLAAMISEGKSIINRIYHLDRGYENLESKLRNIGVKIRRVK